ncbi:MAG: Rrf2 family transcriptional regulator [Lachnospiraceae bacterium]|nr:Rrf2 family transcriptional regulator [Lachnospiraceae bacterium]MBP5601028.1 Rrf2 family transcriptional regulator [Lachnospiraceae bacterium]MBR5356251.1 Rrf2 family transcriptional regulator [Lachnospiraceae bacterium]
MMISTKGRYAIRALSELGKYKEDEFVSLKVISEKQDISRKYLESIMLVLVQNGLVKAVSGKNGGYSLARRPKEISLMDILKVTEGGLQPVSCVVDEGHSCVRSSECHTFPIWKGLYDVISDYLENKTLEDVMEKQDE